MSRDRSFKLASADIHDLQKKLEAREIERIATLQAQGGATPTTRAPTSPSRASRGSPRGSPRGGRRARGSPTRPASPNSRSAQARARGSPPRTRGQGTFVKARAPRGRVRGRGAGRSVSAGNSSYRLSMAEPVSVTCATSSYTLQPDVVTRTATEWTPPSELECQVPQPLTPVTSENFLALLQSQIDPNNPSRSPRSLENESDSERKASKGDKQYEDLRERAMKGSFPHIEALELIYLAGRDNLGRQIVMVEASKLPTKEVNLEDVLLYCIQTLDPVVSNEYVLLFFASKAKRTNRPSLDWLKKAYALFNRGYKKNLKTLYIVHPNRLLRATLILMRPFVSNKFWKKVVFIDDLSDIYKSIAPSQITIPNYVVRYNIQIHSRPPVFGATLADILMIEHSNTGVPEVVTKCVSFLRDYMDVQGLFRQSGLSSHIAELKNAFDHGEEVDLTEEEDPHSVASLLKLFLRELADPVFTKHSYDTFLQIQLAMKDMEDAWLSTISNLLCTLPEENLRVMKIIFDLAHDMQQHADTNLMDAKNLSIVLAPNLLRGFNDDTLATMKDTPITNGLVRKMIEHYDTIFTREPFLSLENRIR